MKKKHIKYVIMKWTDMIKLFWNKYIQKTTYQTEERTERAWKTIENNFKIRNSRFYENFYSQNCRMIPVFD